ncbi:MAG: hypothetical protein NZ901_09825 [Geminocystis sp.]|nr:hypothetical protein [Geminocystis sp.]MCS7148472.1 hypothetical protein [Geminocystis sp.]MCX8079428.1 hypothetical protein [Geminocystis sp.]MDW8114954.1 hypothetical protein [Geminocystis sp.]MDW8464220.1 hypothetical protein [Geminocystis sp.]
MRIIIDNIGKREGGGLHGGGARRNESRQKGEGERSIHEEEKR